jgi:hypothetical protein
MVFGQLLISRTSIEIHYPPLFEVKKIFSRFHPAARCQFDPFGKYPDLIWVNVVSSVLELVIL